MPDSAKKYLIEAIKEQNPKVDEWLLYQLEDVDLQEYLDHLLVVEGAEK
ncbi:MAG: hypothetical protein ACFFBD_09230 [Candidatus Hodarchaeota archaeon]